jgi:phytoene desaturase
MSQKKVVVIGGGLGGMASACFLAKEGFSVSLYEKNEQFGGRAGVFTENTQHGGFIFDMGPSWYLMPDVFERFFKNLGVDIKDHLNLTRMDPNYRIFFEEINDYIDIRAKPEDNFDTFEKLELGSSKKFQEYLEKAEYQYKVAIKDFIYKNYDSVLDFINIRTATEGLKLRVFNNLHKTVKNYFKTPAMQKIMEYTLVFLGSSPYTTPALYSIMTHVDFNLGVFYPSGGIGAITKALFDIGIKLGVSFYIDAPVTGVETNFNQIKKIKIGGNPKKVKEFNQTQQVDFNKVVSNITHGNHTIEIEADIVVSNAPYSFTESLLYKKQRGYSDNYWEKQKMAPGAMLNYIGYKGNIPQFRHHTLYFSQDWNSNFADIFDRRKLPEDPSIYICNPSKTDTTIAPEGYENLVILTPVSAFADDSRDNTSNYKAKIYSILKDKTGVDIESNKVFDKTFSNKDFASRYNSLNGSALGISHDLFQTAVFRPKNKSKKIENLYFAGADTQPGIGMPIVLISAELVKDRINKDLQI